MGNVQKNIDFVIAWVDGNDMEWRKDKLKHQYPDQDIFISDSSDIRYRDWENLKYWFRAVEKYAPWVNQVHLVTYGHYPQWLNLEAKKLNLVKHSDYIPDKYLPTFSSHPIELNLHRIPGLAEHFVYFNDDFFLTAPVEQEDFFKDGLPCDSLEETPMHFFGPMVMNQVNINDVDFANTYFKRKVCRRVNRNKWHSLSDPHVAIKNLVLSILNDDLFFGFNIHHLPQAYNKQTLEKVWELAPELMDNTCSHKFRDSRDVSQCVFKFWQLLSGKFVPYNKRKYGHVYRLSQGIQPICDAIENKSYKTICMNDAVNIDFEDAKKRINASFEKVLSEKSSFEL